MTKVVSTSLILIALCGSVNRVSAQDAPLAESTPPPAASAPVVVTPPAAVDTAAAAADAAGQEAVRRQALTIQLRRVLEEAAVLLNKKDIQGASKKYEEAYTLVEKIGVAIDPERVETVAGLTETRMELARRAQSRNDLNEANAQVTRVLRVNPTNEEAMRFKTENDKKIADRLGKEPSAQAMERVGEVQKEKINTSILVQDARLLMEMGKLNEAESKLRQAVKEDPEHRAAFYYLTLIQEKRYAQEARKREVMAKERMVEVEREWNATLPRDLLPSANPFARTNLVHTSPSRQAIIRKLDKIVFDEYGLESDDLPLSAVILDLSERVRKMDPDRRGVNMIISSQFDRATPAPPVGAFGPGAAVVDPLTGLAQASAAPTEPLVVEDFVVKLAPPLRNVRLAEVLDAIVKVAKPPRGHPMQEASIKYSIEDYAIVFSQRPAEAEPLYTRTFRVDPNTFVQGLENVTFVQSPFLGFTQGIGGGAGGAGGVGGGGGGAGGGQTAGQTAGGVGPGGYFTFVGSIPGGNTAGGGGGGGGGGQTAGGGGINAVTITNQMAQVQDMVRNFFVAAGVDFFTNQTGFGGGAGGVGQPGGAGIASPPRKAIFFNDRTGVLFVRATLRDLDLIESALQALNITPPLVTIDVRFAEISQTDNRALGFDWYLGNTLMADGKMGFQGGTAPSYADGASRANPYGTFPGSGGIPAALPNAQTDGLLTQGFTHSGVPVVGTLSGIMTDPQFRMVIRALEQRKGVDLLSAPKVTTVSGRQARISIEDTQTIIIGLGVQGLGGGGGAVGGGGVGIGAPGGFTAPVAP